MSENLFVKRNQADNEELTKIEIVKRVGVREVQKTETHYLLDFSDGAVASKLLSLLLLDKYIDFEKSYPSIVNLHDATDLSRNVEEQISIGNKQEYLTIDDLNTHLGQDITTLTYSHYLHFTANSLEPTLIETKKLIDNLSSFKGDDFFFSAPYIQSLIFENTNSNNLPITFVKVKNSYNQDTIALRIQFSNGTLRYNDISYNPPRGKIVL